MNEKGTSPTAEAAVIEPMKATTGESVSGKTNGEHRAASIVDPSVAVSGGGAIGGVKV